MSKRGEYRAIHTVLMDGPDFQALIPDERLALLIIKLSLGPSGIDIIPALNQTLVERTGMNAARVEAALVGLERAGWIRRERNVLWLVDGLRYEPSLDAKNQKHRTGVQNHVSGMPHLALVRAYIKAYPDWFDDPDTLSNGYPETADSLCHVRKTEDGRRKTEKGNRKMRAKPPRADADDADPPRDTWLTPALTAWQKHNGPGSLAPGKAARTLKPLLDAGLAPEEIGRRLDRYCAARRGKFCTLADFAEHHAEWAESDAPLLDEHGWMSPELERETRPRDVA